MTEIFWLFPLPSFPTPKQWPNSVISVPQIPLEQYTSLHPYSPGILQASVISHFCTNATVFLSSLSPCLQHISPPSPPLLTCTNTMLRNVMRIFLKFKSKVISLFKTFCDHSRYWSLITIFINLCLQNVIILFLFFFFKSLFRVLLQEILPLIYYLVTELVEKRHYKHIILSSSSPFINLFSYLFI